MFKVFFFDCGVLKIVWTEVDMPLELYCFFYER